MSYFEFVKQTYIENWPAALCRLSIAQADIPLTVKEAIDIGLNMTDLCLLFKEGDEDSVIVSDISDVRRRVVDAVNRFPDKVFIRLGSRSPKDSYEALQNNLVTTHGDDPLRYILDASERMAEDLLLAIKNNYGD